MGLFGAFSQKNDTASTQDHIPFEEIKDDYVILRDGSVSLVLEVSAVNFQLLSEKEQEAKIKAFGDLLNSITFPLQVAVHTEKKDVRKYLEWLNSQLKTVTNQALRQQISLYMEFVKGLVVRHNVLQKTFYVVIPFISPLIQRETFSDRLKEAIGKEKESPLGDLDKLLERAKIKLGPRKEHVEKQLKRMGIESRQLTTPELVALFHRIYNPTEYVPLSIKREVEERKAAGV
jgi:type IV secretory pathway VirB4 component